jgi:hypothetical protein
VTIEIESVGSGKFKGHRSNIGSYEYTEESTPIIPGQENGGLGALSFEVSEDDRRSILLYNDEVTLLDSKYGIVSGFITSLETSEGVVSATGFGRLGNLNTIGTLTAKNTTLGGLVTEILNAAGIIGNINVDSTIASIPVVSPGYTGDLWVYLKNVCAAYQVEVSLIEDTVFIRPIRERTLNILNAYNESFSLNDVTIAQSVDVNYYNYAFEGEFLAYPKGGWSPDISVYQVDAGEVSVVDIAIDAFLTSVKQPIVQDFVAIDYTGPDSVYCVAGNDGLPIPSALWTDRGGSIELELDNNGSTIRATITGANIASLAPFTIGLSDGATTYSTLRIRGEGVSFDVETLNVPTGLTDADTPNKVGATIDNKLISTREQAFTAGVKARLLNALPERRYEVSGDSFFNPDQSEVDIYNTFIQYDDTVGVGYTFDQFDAQNAGLSFDEFDESNTRSTTQSFGSLAGSRVRYREALYRVRSAVTTAENVTVSADFDTILDDFNKENEGRTFRDMATAFFDLKFNDFALVPLRTQSGTDFFTLDDEVLGILDENVLAY